jgi:hypothetical protein
MNWLKDLRVRWKTGSIFQIVLILAVFACTGITVVYLMKPVLKFLFGEYIPIWGLILYCIFVLPVYNIFLLFYGFIFGQFNFFWTFEKRLFKRIFSVFGKK